MDDIDRRLPNNNEIFLDHVGHFVPDREAARAALAQAGFTATPLSIQVNPDPDGGAPQPAGTGNSTAMFDHGYTEVLFKSADTPLGRELDAAVKRYAGVHLAAFAVADAARAHQRLAAAGFRVRPLVAMQREVETETGDGIVAFTVARVEPDVMPEGRIQILTHRTEATIWQSRWLAHANGTTGLIDLVIAVVDVDEAAERFSRFTERPVAANAFGKALMLDRGCVQLMTARDFSARFPALPIPSLPFAGLYALRVRSLDKAEAVLREGGLDCRRDGKTLLAHFPDALGTGAWIFVETAADLPWR